MKTTPPAAARDLEGITVVAVEQAVAAPYASGRLADAGARVIKVERPEGDFARDYDHAVNGESAYFVWLNRGKQSVCLDLKNDGDKRLLAAMIERADIFIQNLAPGVIDRLGFSPRLLRERRPPLITCSISGYGDTGPYMQQKAYDLLVQAETGLSSVTGTPDGPARVGVSVCDIAAGMTAFQGILQALIGRSRTGEGRHISVSLYHALADWMNVPYLQYAYGGAAPARLGMNHPTIAPYGAYICGDGKALVFSIQNEREWRLFCEAVLQDRRLAERPEFAGNSARVAHRLALDAEIDAVFRAAPRAEIVRRLEAAHIAYGRISGLDDLAAHPQNRFMHVEGSLGPISMLAPGLTHDGTILAAGKVPALGEHGDAIRAEFAAPPKTAD
jgi:crotonobetainyl-CoA:carnitine CoA-transferase CaiB-like acyl-CoA transferase